MRSMVSRLALLVLLAALGQSLAESQTRPSTNASVHGVVGDHESRLPLRGVLVEGVAETAADRTYTDADGRFALLSPSLQALRFSKAGFVSRVVTVAELRTAGFRLELGRGGAVSGRFVDSSGVGLSGVVVGVRRRPTGAGATAQRSLTDTDDRGEYRVGGLEEGLYDIELVDVPGIRGSTSLGSRLGQAQAGRLPTNAKQVAEAAVAAGQEVGVPDIVAQFSLPQDRCTGLSEPLPPVDGKQLPTLKGRINTKSGGPISCATVRLARSGSSARVARTDASGNFAFENVGLGTYTIGASHPGYVPVGYGQGTASSSGETITVLEGRSLQAISIAMPRGGVIEGMVTSEDGEPLAGISVRGLLRRKIGEVVTAGGAPNVGERVTDDRGRFRIFGLLPGAYYVRAAADLGSRSLSAGALAGYPVTYYPGTTDIGLASIVDVGPDGSVSGIDLALTGARTFAVAGSVETSPGVTATAVLMFESQRSSKVMVEPRATSVAPGGAFTFTDVTPGEYTIQAIARSAGTAAPSMNSFQFATEFVHVSDSDQTQVNLRTREGAVIAGRVILDGADEMPPMRISAFPTDFDLSPVIGAVSSTRTDEAGRFRVTGVYGRVRIRLETPQAGWYIKSVAIQNSDATLEPFDVGSAGKVHSDVEIRVGNDAPTLAGRVVDHRNESLPGFPILLFSVDRRSWYPNSEHVKFGRSDENGVYDFGRVPPGDYFIVPAEGVGDWSDVDVLEQLSSSGRGSSRIALLPSESRHFNIRVERRRPAR